MLAAAPAFYYAVWRRLAVTSEIQIMLFLHPIWDHESQRVGMQKCHPLGYALRGVGELIGVLGLLSLLGVIGWLIFASERSWWLLAVPFGMGIVSEGMVQASWIMAAKRGFKYDYEKSEASWDVDGNRVSYKYSRQESSSAAHDN